MKQVEVLKREMIKPAESGKPISNSGRIQLSPHDRAMRYAAYQRRIVFYRKPPAAAAVENFSRVVDRVRDSLSAALLHFFPLAGRLILEIDSTGRTSMHIDCSNPSVPFSRAKLRNITLEELQISDFAPSELCDELCDMDGSWKWPWSPEYPLLIVQVTEFACGGFSIGFAFSHQVCDGPSSWHFFKSWSELNKLGSLSNLPDVGFPVREPEMDVETTLEVASTIGLRLLSIDKQEHASPLLKGELKMKKFTVDQEAIAKLKQLTKQEHGGKEFTTYQVLVAYFWRQTTMARNLEQEQRLHFLLLMNCRERFEGLPKFYFGNAATSMFVECTVCELQQNGVAFAANLLNKAITGCSEQKVEAELSFFQHAMDHRKGYASLDFDPRGFSMVVCSPRYPVYECDFGFGTPVGVTVGTHDLHDGKLYLFPSSRKGSIEVTVVLQADALARLDICL